MSMEFARVPPAKEISLSMELNVPVRLDFSPTTSINALVAQPTAKHVHLRDVQPALVASILTYKDLALPAAPTASVAQPIPACPVSPATLFPL